MGHDNFLDDLYDSYPTYFISQSQLESPLDDLTGYAPFSQKTDSKSRLLSPTHKDWSSHSHFGDVLSSLDSPVSPDLSYIDDDEPWSPGSATSEPDDDASLASSVSSLSPHSDLDTFPGEPVEDEDDDNFYARPLTFSPPSLGPLDFLSLSEPGQQSTSKKSSSLPFQPSHYNYNPFDLDSSAPLPSSPSRRRSATLPELEPSTFNTDLFGLHKSTPEAPHLGDVDMDAPEIRWCSFPGYETDDDLIPAELASKNYIPDPSIIVPTASTGKSSLLFWDNDLDDPRDIPTRRSPPPEDFYLDPTILAECGDEELRKVYELRQRTSKSEKWERDRCRELSALLRLKLDERGVLGGREGGDCSNPRSGSSPSPSSTPQLTSGKSQSEEPKHKIRSIPQLVASMIFHRQCDALRRYPRKVGFESTSCSSDCTPSSLMGGAGMKVPSTPKSRLSKVILPEELELDSEGKDAKGLDMEEIGEKAEDHMDVGDGSLDIDLDKGGSYGNSSGHTVNLAAPLCTRESSMQ